MRQITHPLLSARFPWAQGNLQEELRSVKEQCSKLRLERAALKRQLVGLISRLSELETRQSGAGSASFQEVSSGVASDSTVELLHTLMGRVERGTGERYAALQKKIALLRERLAPPLREIVKERDPRPLAVPSAPEP